MATVAERYVGREVLRKEDPEFLTGRARYVDDMALPGMVWMAVVRSPFAHARIRRVDVSRALAMPGVLAAFSGADLQGEWAGPLPMAWPVTEDIKNPPMYPLATDEARYQGEPVAVVVAESRARAKDAAEAVDVDYEPLPAVVSVEDAVREGAPLVHADLGTNASYTWTLTNGDVEKAFAEAPVVVKGRYYLPRLIPTAMEPRGAIADADPFTGDITLWSSTQIPHITRVTMAAFVLGMPEQKLRVIAPRVGGGFGSKIRVSHEEALLCVLSRRLGRPVKWIEERSENYLATHHGRDVLQEIELAADGDGRIRAYRVKLLANMGAYLFLVAPGIPLLGAFLYCGPYGGEAYHFECTGVFTNTTPTDAYRGAGRPEATYAIERTIDQLARRVGKDPVEIRRINFLPPFTEPTKSPGGLEFDAGDYGAALDKALQLVGYDDLRKEQRARRERGDVRQLGIGFSSYIEMCGLAPSRILGQLRYGAGGWDAASVRVLPTGKVEVAIGTTPHGQGHETTFAQIVADDLGVPVEDVDIIFGDTELVPRGMDTYGSRSLSVGGVAVHRACQKVVEKARRIAAHMLEVAEEDLEYDRGTFRVRGAPDKAKTIAELALPAWTAHDLPEGVEPGLDALSIFDPVNFTFPYGTHVAVVEVDTETGETRIVRYVAVDDVGTVVNPMVVDGQVAGGVVQGIAEALYEEARYDENGQLLTANLATYAVPAAPEVPAVTIGRQEIPSSSNELGVKGVGETGTIAAPAAVMNAVVDALSHLGVTEVERPATPEKVWRAIQRAKGGGA